jgi:Ser/Thr protein kinase RdoA (MazF antagonist)
VLDLTGPEVRAVLGERYGLRPDRLVRVDAELATVCRVEQAGRRWAVKVTRDAVEERAALRWRTDVMRSLTGRGLPVPGLLPDRDGDVVSAAAVAGTPVLVTVEQWVDGTPLRAAAHGPGVLAEVGRTAARLSQGLATAPPPPLPLTHPWDAVRGRESVLRALPEVRGAEERSLAARAADAFAAEVEPLLPVLPRAVVHQDLHDGNLLVGGTAAHPRVVGVLDFGDLLQGLRVAELAVAAGYAARLTPEPLEGLLAVVAGWGDLATLTDVEVEVLLPLARTRLAVNLAVWSARSTGPRAAYAADRSAGSLAALRGLLAADPAAVAAEVRRLTSR